MEQRLDDLAARFLAQQPQLLAFTRALVRDRDEAEEIVQEVWLRAMTAARRGREVECPERWFGGVAKNLVLHHFRSRRTAKVVADSRLVELVERVDLAFAEQDIASDDLRRRLAGCVERLPEKSRELLRMKYEGGLRCAQIAGKLGRTEDAIMKALSRIRQLLGNCVKGRRREEEPE